VRIFISTGEKSGDQNAAFLVLRLKEIFPKAEFVGVGGENLKSVGVKIVANPQDIAVVGLQEALRKLKAINHFRKVVLREALQSDLFLAVDFPGFNLPLALKLKEFQKKVIYYIAPQVWAWGKWRVRHLSRLDGVLVVLPFEEPYLRSYGVNAHFVGHPAAFSSAEPTLKSENFTVGFLPGSRPDEIRRLFPRMLKIANELHNLVPDTRMIFSLPERRKLPLRNAKVVKEKGREVIASSDVVVMASGTATLEAALEKKPAVVLYALSEISWWLGRLLVKTRCISLPNIILGKRVYPEYVQHIDPRRIAEDILNLHRKRDELIPSLQQIKMILSKDGIRDAVTRILSG